MIWVDETSTVRRKSPQLKKQDEYENEHRYLAEYPKAYRKNRPRKKARNSRQQRRKVRQVIGATDRGIADTVMNEIAAAKIAEPVHRVAVNLRTYLSIKAEHRSGRAFRKTRKSEG